MYELSTQEIGFVSAGLDKAATGKPKGGGESFWDEVCDWIDDVFGGGGGGGGGGITTQQAQRACNDVGITSRLAGAASGDPYTKKTGGYAGGVCNEGVNIIEQHKKKMQQALKKY